MEEVTVHLAEGDHLVLPLKVTDGLISHIGIVPPTEPVGWSRLYMHLWRTGERLRVGDDNAIETWVQRMLNALNAYDARIHPWSMTYEHAVQILTRTGKINAGVAVPFDAMLKDPEPTHDDNWFFRVAATYSRIFIRPEEVRVLKGGFVGWWMRLEHAVEEPALRGVLGGAPATPDIPVADYQTRPDGLYRVEDGTWTALDAQAAYADEVTREVIRDLMSQFVKRLRVPITLAAGERILAGTDDFFLSDSRKTVHLGIDVGSRVSTDGGKTVYSRCRAAVFPVYDGGVFAIADERIAQKVCLGGGPYRLLLDLSYKHVTAATVLTPTWKPLSATTSVGTLTGYEGGCVAYDARFPTVPTPCSDATRISFEPLKGMHLELEVRGFFPAANLVAQFAEYRKWQQDSTYALDAAARNLIEDVRFVYNEMILPAVTGNAK